MQIKFAILYTTLVCMAFKKSEPLIIDFKLVYNNEPLVLSTKQYQNKNCDSLYIDSFRFYISGLSFKSGTKWYSKPDMYFLIDAEDSSSQRIFLDNVPEKTDSVSFYIGVDSIANVSGALDGALDPVKGMYWAWNTGYINAKLEGRSNVCKTVHHAFEFHIGGYLPPYKTMRKVRLKLPDHPLVIYTDVSKWLESVNLKETNSIVMPCKEALIMADNYKHMFSVK